jgi:hypothetical protein
MFDRSKITNDRLGVVTDIDVGRFQVSMNVPVLMKDSDATQKLASTVDRVDVANGRTIEKVIKIAILAKGRYEICPFAIQKARVLNRENIIPDEPREGGWLRVESSIAAPVIKLDRDFGV